MTLDELALRYGTDKASTHHNYTETYERYLQDKRDTTRGILELGIGGKNYKGVAGSSLQMWRDYFTNAQVVGVDIDPSADAHYGDRVSVVIGDQTRRSTLEKALSLLPSVDIIVDDGAHINTITIASFEYLFPKLRPGGLYVIEDTVCVSELRLGNTRPQIEVFLQALIRGIETNGRIMTKGNNSDFYKIPGDYVLNVYERWIEYVTIYRGLYFIGKRPR
jgi:hypothetical protein